MGGGGGKSSTSTQNSPYASTLAAIGNQSWQMSKPALQLATSQTAEALQTGGVNARIPAVNSSLASAREAASTSQQSLKDRLATVGLLNSSFGQEILGSQEATAGQEIAQIPANTTDAFINRGLPLAENMATRAVGATQGAGSLDTTSTYTPSFWQFFTQGLQAASTGVGSGVGAFAAGA